MRYSFKSATRKPRIALTMLSNKNPPKTSQKVVATKPARPTQKIAVIGLLVAKCWITCRSQSWRWVWEHLDTSSYALFFLSPQAFLFPRSSKHRHGSRSFNHLPHCTQLAYFLGKTPLLRRCRYKPDQWKILHTFVGVIPISKEILRTFVRGILCIASSISSSQNRGC
jgi:hypothetical protein